MSYKKIGIILFILSFGLILFFVITKVSNKSIESFTYFPFDKETTFTLAKTALTQDNDIINWSLESSTSEPVYLRQDISLLYANGQFKGVISKWKENVDDLHRDRVFAVNEATFFEAISVHHSEKHYNENDIRSLQMMSHDYLYVYESETDHFASFKTSEDERELRIKKHLDEKMSDQLTRHFNDLIQHFNLKEEDYINLPLTSLISYNEKNLPSITKDQTKELLGQLWEGLYKNYVIELINSKATNHYLPLILIDKKMTRLFVLYELNGEKIILKQEINLN